MLNESEFRQSDVSGEKEVGLYLDEKFYKIYTNDFKRITDFESQVNGIDTTFVFNNKKIICDEKVALNYINRPLNTFAMELMFKNRIGECNVGWFLDKEKLTTHYLLCYITKCNVDKYPKKCDINEMEIILVSKVSLLEFLNRSGFSHSELMDKALKIYEGEDSYFGNMYRNGYKFSKSEKFVESPVNVLIRKEVLIENSIKHIFIS